jgi:hypothetical protein
LLVIWPALIFLFFSIPASKIVGYILPVVPPLALLIGEYIDRKISTFSTSSRKSSLLIKILPALPVFGAAIAIALLLLIPRYLEKNGIQSLAATVQAQWQPEDEIVIYRSYFQDIPVYLKTRQPLKIVDDWDDKNILNDDNWRREFYFALQHQPEAREWLISEQDFSTLLKTHRRVFVFASQHDLANIRKKYALEILAQTENSVLLSNTTSSTTSRTPR